MEGWLYSYFQVFKHLLSFMIVFPAGIAYGVAQPATEDSHVSHLKRCSRCYALCCAALQVGRRSFMAIYCSLWSAKIVFLLLVIPFPVFFLLDLTPTQASWPHASCQLTQSLPNLCEIVQYTRSCFTNSSACWPAIAPTSRLKSLL